MLDRYERKMKDRKIFVGDIDEYYCDAVEGDKRWAVWSVDLLAIERLLGRFDTEEEAEAFATEVRNGMD